MTQPLLLDGVTAQQIFDDNVSDLKLSWIGGLEGADRTFPPEAVKAAAASSALDDLVRFSGPLKSDSP